MKLLKLIAYIVLILIPQIPLTIMVVEYQHEVSKLAAGAIMITQALLVLLSYIVVDKLIKSIDNKILADLDKMSIKSQRIGAIKLAQLLKEDTQMNKIIDVRVPIKDASGNDIGHGYGHSKINKIIQEQFNI